MVVSVLLYFLPFLNHFMVNKVVDKKLEEGKDISFWEEYFVIFGRNLLSIHRDGV